MPFPVVQEVNGRYVASSPPQMIVSPGTWMDNLMKKSNYRVASTLSIPAYYVSLGRFVTGSEVVVQEVKHLRQAEQPKALDVDDKEIGGQGDHDECPPVSGRSHIPVQTDIYLEELCDVIDEADEACQTDPALDRPPSPLFIPQKSGIDKETQIYPGELFDFDKEVEPTLWSLVGETCEQAQIEVRAEEELKELEEQQKEFQQMLQQERFEALRLEEQERREQIEKENRLKQHEEAVKFEEETKQKIVAHIVAHDYLKDLLPNVYRRLSGLGYFDTLDPDAEEIEEDICPWLLEEVSKEITTLEASSVMLDALVDEAVSQPLMPYYEYDKVVVEQRLDEMLDLIEQMVAVDSSKNEEEMKEEEDLGEIEESATG